MNVEELLDSSQSTKKGPSILNWAGSIIANPIWEGEAEITTVDPALNKVIISMPIGMAKYIISNCVFSYTKMKLFQADLKLKLNEKGLL